MFIISAPTSMQATNNPGSKVVFVGKDTLLSYKSSTNIWKNIFNFIKNVYHHIFMWNYVYEPLQYLVDTHLCSWFCNLSRGQWGWFISTPLGVGWAYLAGAEGSKMASLTCFQLWTFHSTWCIIILSSNTRSYIVAGSHKSKGRSCRLFFFF